MSRYLDKSRFVSICLDDLDKYLDEDKSWPKNLDFKNLDREKKKVDLHVMDNDLTFLQNERISIV